MPALVDEQIQTHWHPLSETDPVWREIEDEFTDDGEQFRERHYAEFVTFLPYVQRLLYGEGKSAGGTAEESPIRVFRRRDVARARLTFSGESDPVELEIAHVDLYFFYDLDVGILVVELWGDRLG